MATEKQVRELKRRYGPRLLRTPGVSGVGIERGPTEDDYVLVIHLASDDPAVQEALARTINEPPVRFVHTGKFRKF